MLALRSTKVRLTESLTLGHGYIVPRADGRIIAGSTLENVGFVKETPRKDCARFLTPPSRSPRPWPTAEIVETWAGLRPGSPDQLPIIGPTDIPGLLIATGHYRNGILLAPVTAKLICDWIVEGKTNFNAQKFSPLRFSAATSHTESRPRHSRRFVVLLATKISEGVRRCAPVRGWADRPKPTLAPARYNCILSASSTIEREMTASTVDPRGSSASGPRVSNTAARPHRRPPPAPIPTPFALCVASPPIPAPAPAVFAIVPMSLPLFEAPMILPSLSVSFAAASPGVSRYRVQIDHVRIRQN